MRLDLFDPDLHPRQARQESGTPPTPGGVWNGGPAQRMDPARRHPLRTGLLLATLAFSFLGLGERCIVDRRLLSPSSTIRNYWESLRSGDESSAAASLVDGFDGLPQPGELWFLPPTTQLEVVGFRSLPVSSGRVMVSYEVRYLPEGTGQILSFRSGSELIRERGEWRILRALGEASLPEWKPVRRTVDS